MKIKIKYFSKDYPRLEKIAKGDFIMKDTRRKVSRNWDVCPICGRALVFTMDYSQSACVDPECRYNNEREFNFTLNKEGKYEIILQT